MAIPLPLDKVVRWRRALCLDRSLAAVPIVLLAFAAIRSTEWRTAIKRAVLIETPYTTVEVTPGDVLIEQGEDVPVAVELKGRPRKSVVLQSRPMADPKPDAPWKFEGDRKPLSPGKPSRSQSREGEGPPRIPGRRRPEPRARVYAILGSLPAGDQGHRGSRSRRPATPGSTPRRAKGATSRPWKGRSRPSRSPSTPCRARRCSNWSTRRPSPRRRASRPRGRPFLPLNRAGK